MSMTDPVADYLTRLRNAIMARHNKVDVPASNMVKAITKILLDEGYILNFTPIEDSKQGLVRIYLKYGENKKCAITGIERVSKPGLRRYAKVEDIPKVLGGLGIAVLSTPKGILTNRQARKEKVGGEVLCMVW
jgi:small subunit ribosomal protein S8